MTGVRRLSRDERGAVLVEHLIAFLPVVIFALATWQLAELCVGHLLVKRAASAAARAAVVVLPDNGVWYGGADVNAYEGERQIDVELAAALVLARSQHFTTRPTVRIGGNPSGGIRTSDRFRLNILEPDHNLRSSNQAGPHGTLTAQVEAEFQCAAGWVNFVCGGSSRRLTAAVSLPYQGASYDY